MTDHSPILYLHGLLSSSQSGKARLFAQRYPWFKTPDFTGDFHERMNQLAPILAAQSGWTLVGSSFGGLMAAIFALDHPSRVRRLVLLAPALMLPPFPQRAESERSRVPTVIVHGSRDDVVSPGDVRALAEKVFMDLEYHLVDDDHRLQASFEQLDWDTLLGMKGQP